MKIRRLARALVFSVALLSTVYVMLAPRVRLGRKRPRKILLELPHTVMLDEQGYINRNEDIDSANPSARHAFNVALSNQIPIDRRIPDSRHQKCKNEIFDYVATTSVSVIISFYNEARSALLRTVMSVLNRTPDDFLEEIILVDDFSDNAEDGMQLSVLPKVKILRNNVREGLVRSRARGTEAAIGEHLMFLDSHCEVNVGWLQPLVYTVMKNPKALASPVIDIIDMDTLEYKSSSAELKGGFDWSLHFQWQSLTPAERSARLDPTLSFKSPIIPGGLFLVQKAWFQYLGGFDPGLEIWGAENFEISIKSWLCGGQVETVPCSRVGHVFRKRHPYTFPNGSSATYLHNSRRVADVWMDEYSEFFYDTKPEARKVEVGSIEGRLKLKQKLKCKPFQWFMENIYPDLRPLRTKGRDSLAFGQLQQGNACLEGYDLRNHSSILLSACSSSKPIQEWAFSKDGEVHHKDYCLTVIASSSQNHQVSLEKCSHEKKQKWSRRRRLLIHQVTRLCLETADQTRVVASPCQRRAYSQQWDFSMELQAWQDR